MNLDENTKQNVASALWEKEFVTEKIPKEISKALMDPKNNAEENGARFKHYLHWLLNHPQSHNPNYTKRYKTLLKYCDSLSTQQLYVIASKFLGLNSSQDFEQMPKSSTIKFPRDHSPQLRSKVGWHFFVGSAWGSDGNEYGVELMFFRVAILPPNMAAELGLSDIENQIVEMQLGISKVGDIHHQADPVIVAGTSGLIDFEIDPFMYRLGKNEMKSLKKGKLFPMNLKAKGIDRNSGEMEIGVDLEFSSGKEYLMQGDNGCMPCVDGLGTLYYSIPNIELKAGSSLIYNGKKVTLKNGLFWFDHQWGFLSANPHSAVLRAANNMAKPAPAGWDWYMAQFNGNRQLTMFAAHSSKYEKYYFQTGPESPGVMTIDVAGKYMDKDSKLYNTSGTLIIDDWVKSEISPNPSLYPVTHTWHPNAWHFSFDQTMPEDIRQFSMHQIVNGGQTNFFANGSQYGEGAVYLKDKNGKDIGRGFAEAVQYADTSRLMLQLAGFPINKETNALNDWDPPLLKRLSNTLYMLTHQKQLKQVLSEAAGLDFFAKPKKQSSRH